MGKVADRKSADNTKYNIGDKVYHATFKKHTGVYVECPDCGGTGRMRCIFHDETIVSIVCGSCSPGYDPPTGKILVYNSIESVDLLIITGIEVEADKPTRYKADHYILDEDHLFNTKDEALVKAKEMHDAHVEMEKDKIYKKEKDTRSWAWNASYHRGLIKRAEKDIIYHTSKLNVANLKKKDNQ